MHLPKMGVYHTLMHYGNKMIAVKSDRHTEVSQLGPS